MKCWEPTPFSVFDKTTWFELESEPNFTVPSSEWLESKPLWSIVNSVPVSNDLESRIISFSRGGF